MIHGFIRKQLVIVSFIHETALSDVNRISVILSILILPYGSCLRKTNTVKNSVGISENALFMFI